MTPAEDDETDDMDEPVSLDELLKTVFDVPPTDEAEPESEAMCLLDPGEISFIYFLMLSFSSFIKLLLRLTATAASSALLSHLRAFFLSSLNP